MINDDPTKKRLPMLLEMERKRRAGMVAPASSTAVDPGVMGFLQERNLVGDNPNFGSVLDQIRADGTFKRPPVRGMMNSAYEKRAWYYDGILDGWLRTKDVPTPTIQFGRKVGDNIGESLVRNGRDLYDGMDGSAFVLGHEYGHHLQSYDPNHPKSIANNRMGRFGNEGFYPVTINSGRGDPQRVTQADQFDADLTGYVMSERGQDPNKKNRQYLTDSTAYVEDPVNPEHIWRPPARERKTVLALLQARRDQLDKNKSTYTPLPGFK